MNNRLKKQFEFILEADKEKQITRQNYLSDGSRRENDSEHAWHMALMTVLLSEYANEEIDVLKAVTMILIHDIVEIDAGDTYCYDPAARATQAEREKRAAERLYGLLPEDQCKKLRSLWEEFEECQTPEAKFARAMDNIQPLMLNSASEGKSWEEHSVRLGQILERNKRTKEGSEDLWKFAYEEFVRPNVENSRIIAEE
ncbi:MAG: HD domain-containing protein [Clostridia bacterium]|nr:HD domain-containing protein [Clostridia bacterium]